MTRFAAATVIAVAAIGLSFGFTPEALADQYSDADTAFIAGVSPEIGRVQYVDKAVMDQITATGCDAEILPPARTLEKIKADYVKWGRVVKDANIRAD